MVIDLLGGLFSTFKMVWKRSPDNNSYSVDLYDRNTLVWSAYDLPQSTSRLDMVIKARTVGKLPGHIQPVHVGNFPR